MDLSPSQSTYVIGTPVTAFASLESAGVNPGESVQFWLTDADFSTDPILLTTVSAWSGSDEADGVSLIIPTPADFAETYCVRAGRDYTQPQTSLDVTGLFTIAAPPTSPPRSNLNLGLSLGL